MNIRIFTLLAVIMPLNALDESSHTSTPTPTSASTSPTGSFSHNNTIYPGLETRQTLRQAFAQNSHLVTQFTIGAAANMFSRNTLKEKLIANGIGATCGFAAHLLLNSDYGRSWLQQKTDESSDTQEQAIRCPFKKLVCSDYKKALIGYGAGASVGTLARFGYDKTMQWLASRAEQQQRASVQKILENPFAPMYCGEQTALDFLKSMDTPRKSIGGHPAISKQAWDNYIEKDLKRIKQPYSLFDDVFWIEKNKEVLLKDPASFAAWKTWLVDNLKKSVQDISKEVSNGTITPEVLAKLHHNKKLVDETFMKIIKAVLI